MCPEAHTFCKDVVASITKRAGLLRQKEVGSFLWSVGKGGGCRPQWLETSVRWRIGELPRIPLPRTPVNKGKAKDRHITSPSYLSTSKRPRVRTQGLFASSFFSRVRPT